MADENGTLSDAELRAELKSYGVNPGPILASTRPTLLKKLNILKKGEIENQNTAKQQAKKRRSVASSTPTRHKAKLSGFSSGEEDFPSQSVSSVDTPSTSSRRRSVLPKVVYINKTKDDISNTISQPQDETEEKGPKASYRRRSLPRSSARPTKSLESFSNDFSKPTSTVSDSVDDSQIHQIRSNVRKNSFEFEDEEVTDGSQLQENVTMRKKSPLKTVHSSDTSISYQKTRRSPRKANQTMEYETSNLNDSKPSKNSEDNEQEEEELEVAFARPAGFLNQMKGPVFVLVVAILLMCLVGSYVSLFSDRLSALPAGNDTMIN